MLKQHLPSHQHRDDFGVVATNRTVQRGSEAMPPNTGGPKVWWDKQDELSPSSRSTKWQSCGCSCPPKQSDDRRRLIQSSLTGGEQTGEYPWNIPTRQVQSDPVKPGLCTSKRVVFLYDQLQ